MDASSASNAASATATSGTTDVASLFAQVMRNANSVQQGGFFTGAAAASSNTPDITTTTTTTNPNTPQQQQQQQPVDASASSTAMAPTTAEVAAAAAELLHLPSRSHDDDDGDKDHPAPDSQEQHQLHLIEAQKQSLLQNAVVMPPPPPPPPQPASQQQQKPDSPQPEQQEKQEESPPQNGNNSNICRICNANDGRPLIHFRPAPPPSPDDPAPVRIRDDDKHIAVHVFCGKTAAILPTSLHPELEILNKAGIKNKHGIGPQVNSALSRTRSGCIEGNDDNDDDNTDNNKKKKKQQKYYLVREFEANYALMRRTIEPAMFSPPSKSVIANASGGGSSNISMTAPTTLTNGTLRTPNGIPTKTLPAQIPPNNNNSNSAGQSLVAGAPFDPRASSASTALAQFEAFVQQQQQLPASALGNNHHNGNSNTTGTLKLPPIKAKRKASTPPRNCYKVIKIQCECGGTHLPTFTPKGVASWRTHVATKRHQKWMQQQQQQPQQPHRAGSGGGNNGTVTYNWASSSSSSGQLHHNV